MQNECRHKDARSWLNTLPAWTRVNSKRLFSLFTEASKQLSDAYADLQQQVEFLTKQLEIANGNLRRELEEKAALSRRLTVLLEQLPGGVVEVDERNQVAAMNPAARAMLAPLQQGDDWSGFRSQALTPTSSDDLWVYPRSQGSLRLNIKESAMPAENRRILLVQDLTQSWSLEQALARHQRLATMGEMAAGLAHQLRTPLATALLYAGHLAKPVLPEADRIKFGEKNPGAPAPSGNADPEHAGLCARSGHAAGGSGTGADLE